MGLDTTHGCWHGAYSAFHRWREGIAEAAGLPLGLMEGYWSYGPLEETDEMPAHVTAALDWLAPREGGPRCGSDHGPVIHRLLTEILRWLPLSWDVLRDDPLLILLNHSDCEGIIAAADCGPLADRLEGLLPLLPDEDGGGHSGPWRGKTQRFIDGLRLAAARGEDVEFH